MQQGLETWFLRKAHFTIKDGTLRKNTDHIEKADKYKWQWFRYDDSVVEENEILMANGWDKVKFNFSGTCIVTVSIKQEETEHICELFQEIFLDTINEIQLIYKEDCAGWGFYLADVKIDT